MKEDVTFQGWVTKYALTVGIEESRLKTCHETASGMVEVMERPYTFTSTVKEKTGIALVNQPWHEQKKMRKDKIASLEKQIEKLKKLTF